MNENFCNTTPYNSRVFVFAAAAVFLLFSGFFARRADAQVFQFKPGDKNYLAALAAVAAEEASGDVNAEAKVESDEDFQPEDFGLQDVGMLPTSPFYFLKNARRGVTSLFTFDPAKKTERNLQFAAEKLLEAKTLAGQEGTSAAVMDRALGNFQRELDRVQNRVENAAGRVEGERAEELSKKVMDSVVKYSKSITKLEKDLPPDAFRSIKDAKDKTSETFGTVFGLIDQDKVSEKLIEVLDEQKGSEFKYFKNLEILKEIKDQVPADARGAIEAAEENSFLKLQNGLEQAETAQKAVFGDFVREVGGDELRHLEIINELEVRPLSQELRDAVAKAKENTFSRTESRLSSLPADQKDKFFEHLTGEELKDIRVFKELENNIRPELFTSVADIKTQATQNFVNKIENIQNDEGQKKEFFTSVERFHDARSIAIFDEIKNLVPEDKKGAFEEIKKKAVGEIQRDIAQARNQEQRGVIYSALAGDHPEEASAIIGLNAGANKTLLGVLAGLQNAQLKNIQTKAANISDKDRLLKFEGELKRREEALNTASRKFGAIFDFLEERRTVFESPDRAQKKIDESRTYVNDLRDLINVLPLDAAYQDGGFDPAFREVERMLQLAERKLGTAQTVLDYNDVGRAYGEAEAAGSIARDGIRLAQEFKSGRKRAEIQHTTFTPFFEDRAADTHKVEREGEFTIFNPYEFSQYCFAVRGFLKGPLTCALTDGRVFSADGRTFPFSIPPEFVPRKIETGARQLPGQVVCPATFVPSYDFCPNGNVVYERDERGCERPPRCEQHQDQRQQAKIHPTDKSLCGSFAGYQCVQGYVCKAQDSRTTDAFGKCVPETQYACQAQWSGYVFDSSRKVCRQESATGCSDPFAFKTVSECERANNIGVKTEICPALPTVNSCPDGQKKVISFSSPGCGTYYACEQEKAPSGITYPYTFSSGFVAKDYASAKAQCLTYPPGSGGGISAECEAKFGIVYGTAVTGTTATAHKWVQKLWTFSDGLSESSMVLDRTDAEYQNYLAKIEAQCRTIPKNKFFWKQDAGDDRPENWQNFGIPDCSGTTSANLVCGNNVCDSGETTATCPADCGSSPTTYPGDVNSCPGFAYSRWDSAGKRYCQLNTEQKCDYNYPSYLTNGSNYTVENCPVADGTGTGTSCSQSLIALLGSGCHQMYTDASGRLVYCNSEMTTSAKEGDSTTTAGCQSGTTQTTTTTWSCQYGTQTACDADSACEWVGGGCASKAGTGCKYFSQSTCDADTACTWANNGCGVKAQCNDGRDNDNDGFIDYPKDSGCVDYFDDLEGTTTVCNYNGVCDGAETSALCPSECAAPSSGYCGDHTCGNGETATSCPADCGSTPGVGTTCSSPSACTTSTSCAGAGYYWCVGNNTCSSSSSSCSTSDYCGDGRCSSTETSTSCQSDCGGGGSTVCNYNGVCDGAETSALCPSECAAPSSGYCGDHTCGNGETATSCPADCGSTACNFNNVCDSGESSGSCPGDCPSSTTTSSACSTPSNCFDQSICASSGWHWYSGGCWSSPESTTTSGGTTACNFNNVCDSGESSGSCPGDCPSGG